MYAYISNEDAPDISTPPLKGLFSARAHKDILVGMYMYM